MNALDIDDLRVDPPLQFGRYEVTYLLGAGAHGVVVAAYDPELERAVAIKFPTDPEGINACHREALALARAVHPNVVALHDFVCTDGVAFIVMDIVHGGTLHEYIQRWHDWREVVRLFIQAARGLAAVHAAGLAHGDVKPANLLIGDDGRVQIADLGLARCLFADDPNAVSGGTRIYMAPERLAGAPASTAADQFSLCVALWEALFGVRPWETNSAEIAGVVPPARARLRPAIPAELVHVLQRGLAVEPTRRHQDMGALADALSRVLLGVGRREGRWLAVWVVIVAGSIILTLAWLVIGW